MRRKNEISFSKRILSCVLIILMINSSVISTYFNIKNKEFEISKLINQSNDFENRKENGKDNINVPYISTLFEDIFISDFKQNEEAQNNATDDVITNNDEEDASKQIERENANYIFLQEIQDFIVPTGYILVYDSDNFNTNNKPVYYSKKSLPNFINRVKSTKNKFSIKVGENTYLVSCSRSFFRCHPFTENSILTQFPFYGNDDIDNIYILSQGEAIFFINPEFTMKHYYMSIENNLNENKGKVLLDEYNKIGSYILGPNTIMKLYYRKIPQLSPAIYKVSLSSEEFEINYNDKQTLYVEFENVDTETLPNPDLNCAMIFPKSYFITEENQEPIILCSDIYEEEISEELIKVHEDKSEKDHETCRLCVENLKDFSKNGKSIIAGENVKPIIFDKPDNQGKAFVINKMALSFRNTFIHNNMISINLLTQNCYYLFSDQFSGKNFKFCFSTNSISKVTWNTTISSIIVGPKTIVQVFSEENYKGKSFYVYESLKDYHYEINIKSIKILGSDKEIEFYNKNDNKAVFHNISCIVFYENKKWLGKSIAVCEETLPKEMDFIFKSLVVTKENNFLLKFKIHSWIFSSQTQKYLGESTGNFFSIEEGKDEKASVLKIDILRPECIIIFSDKYYQGDYFELCDPSPDIKRESGYIKDNIGSIVIGRNSQIILYDGLYFTTNKHKSEVVKESIEDFKTKYSYFYYETASIEFLGREINKDGILYDSGNTINNFFYGLFTGFFFNEFRTSKKIKSSRENIVRCMPKSSVFDSSATGGFTITKEDTLNLEGEDNETLEEKNKSVNVEELITEYASSTEELYSTLIIKQSEENKTNQHLWFNRFRCWFCNFRSKLVSFVGAIAEGINLITDFARTIKNLTINYTIKKIADFIDNKLEEKQKRNNKKKDKENKEKELRVLLDDNNNEYINKKNKYTDINLSTNLGIQEFSFINNDFFYDIENNIYQISDFQTNLNNNNSDSNNDTKQSKNTYIKTKNKIASPIRRKFRLLIFSSLQSIKDAFISMKNYLTSKIKYFFENYIKKPILKAKDFIVKYLKKVKAFLKKLGLTILNVLSCFLPIGINIYLRLLNLRKIIKLVIIGIVLAPTGFGVIILLDFVLAQLCQYKQVQYAINYLKLAKKWKNTESRKTEAWVYYGTAIGAIFNSIATSTPVFKEILDIYALEPEIDQIV